MSPPADLGYYLQIMDEEAGCGLLKQQFTEAGFQIQEDYPLHEGPIRFNVDGFDPVRRVGYEYITTAAGDRIELTPEVVTALESRMAQGAQSDLFIFLIDEQNVSGPEELRRAAARFLDRVRSLRGSAG